MSFVATPTKTKRETVARALQLIQKTNSWTQGNDLVQEKDSQDKTRSQFCLRGAFRAAVGGKTEAAHGSGLTIRQDRLVRGAAAAVIKTVNKNPERYGVEDKVGSIIGFNDNSTVEHRHVVRALRDTEQALANSELGITGCGS